MVRLRTRLTICVSRSRGLGVRRGNKKRGTRLPEPEPGQFKEIAGTATRECSGQSEVADTTAMTDTLWRPEQEQLELAAGARLLLPLAGQERAELGKAWCSSVMVEEMRCVRMCM